MEIISSATENMGNSLKKNNMYLLQLLRPVAEELNEKLGLEPKIEVYMGSVPYLLNKINIAAKLIGEEDSFSPDTMSILLELELLPILKRSK